MAKSATSGQTGLSGRVLLAILAVGVLSSCKSDQVEQQTDGNRNRPNRLKAHLNRNEASLSAEQINAVRECIEARGGTLRCNTDGQPLAIDLAAERGSADPAALNAALSCPGLESLRIRAERLAAEELLKIGTLGSLEELMLQDAAINDGMLEKMSELLTHLKRLTLRNTPAVTDVGAATFVKFTHLTHLTLIDLQITSQALTPIATLPALSSLDIRMCNSIDGHELSALIDAPKLTDLKLGGYGIDDATIRIVARLPHLENLTVEDASMSAEGLASLTASPEFADRIHTLNFARCSGLTDDALNQLAGFPNLKRLSLRDVPTIGAFLTKLAAPENLEILALNQTFLTDEAFDTITSFVNLTRLELARVPLGPTALEEVGGLANLEYLNLTECGIDDNALRSLAGLRNLKTLIVDGNPDVSPEIVNELTGTKNRE